MPKRRKATFPVSEEGTISQAAWDWIKSQLSFFAGDRVKVQIGKPTRTKRQNAYLWGVVYSHVQKGFHEVGFTSLHMMGPGGKPVKIPITKDTLHEFYKHKYIPVIAPDKRISTTALDTTEFTEYIESIRQDEDVLEAGIYIPEPGEEEALNL